MANVESLWRSNYFKVKDNDTFKASMQRIDGLEAEHRTPDDTWCLCCLGHDSGGIPTEYEDDGGDLVEIELEAEVAKHLADGEVAVFVEISSMKLCSLSGRAVAINAAGRTANVDLAEIYAKAQVLAGPGKSVSVAEY